MKVTCSACSIDFDDLDHVTYCPHEWFPPAWTIAPLLTTTDKDLAAFVIDALAVVASADRLAVALERARTVDDMGGPGALAELYAGLSTLKRHSSPPELRP